MKNGGHGIPEEDIIRRNKESIKNLVAVIGLCDKIELFDNTKEFVRVAVYKKGKWKRIIEDIPMWTKDIIGNE